MVPIDDEDFSTLQPHELSPGPPDPPVARQPAPAPSKPVAPVVEPPRPSILSGEPLPEVCEQIKLSDRGRQAIASHRAPTPFLDHLIRQELFEDATRFLAHTLPQREAVGWAYLCARHAHSHVPSPGAEMALALAADWVLTPCEATRLAAQKGAEKAGLGTPAGRACAAAFLTGPDYDLPIPLHKPGKNYAAVGVTAAVICSAVWGNVEKKAERMARFLAEAKEVAGGARPWERDI